jgi:LPS-assembly lipoprotein
MSWSSRLRLPVLLALGLLAAGCMPVYNTTAVSGSVPARLAAIAIDPPAGAIEQEVRNELIFAFTGGGNPAPPIYTLHLSTAVSETLLGVTPIDTAPSYSVNVAVSYELTEIATGRIVTRGVARGVASYDRSNQIFANTRARLDAQLRAAGVAADDIRIRVAASLAADA